MLAAIPLVIGLALPAHAGAPVAAPRPVTTTARTGIAAHPPASGSSPVARPAGPGAPPRPMSAGGIAHPAVRPGSVGSPSARPPAQSVVQVSATSGGITGSVTLRSPKEGAPNELVVEEDRTGAVIYVTGKGFTQEPAPEHAKVAQHDKQFVPSVLAITAGQQVDFPNEDSLFHNVFSVSNARAFDLGMTKAPEVKTIDFTKTGVVEVYCNIHPRMVATIFVLPNRAFQVTGRDGTYAIGELPPGEYKVFAWCRKAKAQNRPLTVVAGQVVRLDWEMTQTEAVQPHTDKYGRPYKPIGGYK